MHYEAIPWNWKRLFWLEKLRIVLIHLSFRQYHTLYCYEFAPVAIAPFDHHFGRKVKICSSQRRYSKSISFHKGVTGIFHEARSRLRMLPHPVDDPSFFLKLWNSVKYLAYFLFYYWRSSWHVASLKTSYIGCSIGAIRYCGCSWGRPWSVDGISHPFVTVP